MLKPLQGSGGQAVFVLKGRKPENLNQIIETITRDGFVVAQEYLRGADRGDVRLFVMNGEALQVDGTFAAIRRRNQTDDPRSNMHAGGKAKPVAVTAEMLRLVELTRPKLVEDGMFLVGLDIIGSKLMEVNVFSPGRHRQRLRAHEGRLRRRRHRGPRGEGAVARRLRLPTRQRHPGDPLMAHLAVQGSSETRKVAGVDGGGSAAWPTRGGDMSGSMRSMRRARLAALTGAVAMLMALLPATAASAAPPQTACDNRDNNTYSKLLECVRLDRGA